MAYFWEEIKQLKSLSKKSTFIDGKNNINDKIFTNRFLITENTKKHR